jgi:hypothetical protein
MINWGLIPEIGHDNLALRFGGFFAIKIEDKILSNLVSMLERRIWPFMNSSCKHS